MKNFITVVTALLVLSACATNNPLLPGLAKPVQIPELPLELSRKATRLPDIKDPTFGGIIKDGAEADQQYNAVSHQLNKLIDLYICVRESINREVDPQTTCRK